MANGDEIDITGLDKADILMALYNNARVRGMGRLHAKDEPMLRPEALALLERSQRFDYLRGRPLKIDLSGDSLFVDLYDRDQGQGAAARIIAQLRQRGQ